MSLPGAAASAVAGAIAVVVALALPSYASAVSAGREPPGPHVVFRIESPRITESSSLVASTLHPGLLYTANDSGDGPYVYVLDSSGRLVGTTTLAGVHPVDVEAMTAGTDGSLIVADVGDNDATRASVRAYQIVQPGRGDVTVKADEVTLTYADGPRNAESVLYDTSNGRLFVVSKELFGSVYESPPHVFGQSRAVLRPVASAPSYATDASFLPGERAAVVRTYPAAFVYRFPSWRLVTTWRLPPQRQGESVAVVRRGRDLLVGSEGTDSPVWQVPLPTSVTGFESQRSAVAQGPYSPPPGAGVVDGKAGVTASSLVGLAALGAAVVAVGGGGALVVRRHRRIRRST